MSANSIDPREKSGPEGRFTANQKATMALALLTAYIVPFMTSALNLSVTDISSQLNSGATAVTWVVSAFTLVVAVLSVPFGHLADVTDRRRIFIAGTVIFAATSLSSALANSIGLLIASRALQGVGSAMIYSTNLPLLLNAFPASMRGRILGYSVTATYAGLSTGPVFGGFMNAAFGWRSIFAVAFAMSAVSMYLAKRFIARSEVSEEHRHDIPGNILYIVMVFSLIFGLSSWRDGLWAKLLVLLAALLMPCFVILEKRSPSPLVQVRLFALDMGYTLSNLTALLNYGATFALSYTMSLYLQNVKGLSSSMAGLVLISQPLVMAVISPFAGRLSERVAPHMLASAGMGISALGLFLLSTIGVDFPLWRIISALAVIGTGFGFFSSPNTNAVLSCVDKSHYGEANSILGTMRTLGQSISMVIIIFILGACVGNVVIAKAPPELLSDAIRTALIIYAFICLAGTGLSLVRSKTAKRRP